MAIWGLVEQSGTWEFQSSKADEKTKDLYRIQRTSSSTYKWHEILIPVLY